MTAEATWSIILHAGAGDIVTPDREASRAGCLAALHNGQTLLMAGASAIEAVVACVRELENNPQFNAGYGSVLNAEGEVEMDASVMDGTTLDIGAVAALQGVRNPVDVAYLMLRERPIFLVADGALHFAQKHNAELCSLDAMIAPRRRRDEDALQQNAVVNGRDTVGCVARDMSGRIAVALSTGGLSGKLPGRVGDSPLPGCGFYADDKLGGVAFSGEGEAIARLILASRVLNAMDVTDVQASAEESIQALAALGADGGVIAIDPAGNIGWAHNSASFAIAYAKSDAQEAAVFLDKNEEKMVGGHG